MLITGGAGFIGCNLADRLAAAGEQVIVLDALSRPGVEVNLRWLRGRHARRVTSIIGDIRDYSAADVVRDASAIFHLAAQVAVTTSIEEPEEDFDVNLCGTMNLLEAARRSNPVPFVFASTNKVYGDLGDIKLKGSTDAYLPVDAAIRRYGISEQRGLCFHTPYGCSKGAAEQYVLDYARTFGLRATVLRMGCIYGPRQLGTEDQGWVAHFAICALAGRPITFFGDGRQVRDILHVDDAVEAYVQALRQIEMIKAEAFNLGGGPANAVSLRQVVAELEAVLGRRIDTVCADWRPGDQRYYVSDTRKIAARLALPAPRPYSSGIAHLVQWLGLSRSRATQRAANHAMAQVRP